MTDISKEVGETTRCFFGVMGANPLSLALVVVVFALSFMLYFSSTATLEQRSVMAKMIIEWQQDQQNILGGCVSADVTKGMMDNMQKITETMLVYNNGEIKRMQEALDKERDRSFRLREFREQEIAETVPTATATGEAGLAEMVAVGRRGVADANRAGVPRARTVQDAAVRRESKIALDAAIIVLLVFALLWLFIR